MLTQKIIYTESDKDDESVSESSELSEDRSTRGNFEAGSSAKIYSLATIDRQ